MTPTRFAPHSGSFKKGHAKLGGRVKGKPNGITTDVKEMILGALNAAPGGGQAWLEQQRDKNPIAFLTLLGRIVPLTMQADTRIEVSLVHVGREMELIDATFSAMRPKLLEAVPAEVDDAAERTDRTPGARLAHDVMRDVRDNAEATPVEVSGDGED